MPESSPTHADSAARFHVRSPWSVTGPYLQMSGRSLLDGTRLAATPVAPRRPSFNLSSRAR